MQKNQDINISAMELGRQMRQLQGSMPSFVQIVIFFILIVATFVFSAVVGVANRFLGALCVPVGIVGSILIASAIKIANQWERGLVLRLGQFSGIRGPGIFFITPVLDRVRMVDTRIQSVDIPRQEVITRDNVPVRINGALFFKVEKVEDAVLKIQDYHYGVSLLAQTALRDVIGGMTLDELLSEREQIGKKIRDAVEKDSVEWGLEVTGIRLMDIDMPEDLKKIMSRQASAEREKRATITKAEGDKMAAENLAAAAMTMAASPGAMQLRTLQTIDGLGPTASNTVLLAVPIEIMEMVKKIGQSKAGG